MMETAELTLSSSTCTDDGTLATAVHSLSWPSLS